MSDTTKIVPMMGNFNSQKKESGLIPMMGNFTNDELAMSMVKPALKELAKEAKMKPKDITKAVEITLLPFAKQGVIHITNKTTEQLKEGMNKIISELKYPKKLIDKAIEKELRKY